MPATVDFYDPAVKASFDPDDEPGATLDHVLTWNDGTLEARHDYIQHLFPLPERSPVNPDAPIITKQIRDAFQQRPVSQTLTPFAKRAPASQTDVLHRPLFISSLNEDNATLTSTSSTNQELRHELRRAFSRMCTFYGLETHDDATTTTTTSALTIGKGVNFDHNADQTWLTSRDHNHLRITRIIRCLRLLGLEPEARRFALALLDADPHAIVSSTSAAFWCRAALWPLARPPSFPREPEVRWLLSGEESEAEAGEQTEETLALDRHISRRRLSV
ncbi:hypothetical protein LTR36_001860 [Oleoguttula mirabilis]|uniref:Opioid growth factor receptor (OGFr) conserved domain-containing protein n=1 Tax=Oleoguttula mirabilis TaxID=1507867 RepID=A0AAV9JMZ8_9PEZI|nr:hypothetical protein LTR36_001860 [Oleoguttula mirabilis]